MQLVYMQLEDGALCGQGTEALCESGTGVDLLGNETLKSSSLYFNICDLGLIKLCFTILKSVMNAQIIPSIAPINTSSEWCI